MRRNLLLLPLLLMLCALVVSCSSKTDEASSIPEEKGPKWGFINHSGKFVIQPEFNRVSKFSEGLAAADKHNRWGYIDRSGAFVIERQFSYAKPFSAGYAAVQNDGLWGAINKKGVLVFPCKQLDVGHPHEVDPDAEDHAVLLPYKDETNKWGFHDFGPHGHGDIAPQWDKVKHFNDGLCPVYNNSKGKWGYINRTGEVVIDYKFDEASVFKNRIAECMMGDDFVWVDQIGTIAKKSRLESLQLFHDRMAVQPSRKKTFIYINREGEPAFKKRFHYADNFSEGLAVVQPVDSHKRGYIDTRGEMVIAPKFDDARVFSEQLAAVRVDPDVFFKEYNKDGSRKKGLDEDATTDTTAPDGKKSDSADEDSDSEDKAEKSKPSDDDEKPASSDEAGKDGEKEESDKPKSDAKDDKGADRALGKGEEPKTKSDPTDNSGADDEE